MGKIAKIFLIISFACLGLMLTFVGVWATANLDFSVGGDITYTAPQSSQGYEVTIVDMTGKPPGPITVAIYINDENKGNYGICSTVWDTLSYNQVKNVKFEVVDNGMGVTVLVVDHNSNRYTTTTETISIDIKENTVLTLSA